ncbi:hypothetical protein ABIB40_002650 [Pedobacter sp. UYP30]|uniref:hypothetical protein n=1 Tax=Pedobacter sp. UYP30 TaxID=1756400 RepID=UPI003395BA6D
MAEDKDSNDNIRNSTQKLTDLQKRALLLKLHAQSERKKAQLNIAEQKQQEFNASSANIQHVFLKLNKLDFKQTLSIAGTELLKEIEAYLKLDLKNIELKYSEDEHKFSKTVIYYFNQEKGFLKKTFSFLISKVELYNTKLLNNIRFLIEQKENVIKSLYEHDIRIVEEYMVYAEDMMKSGEFFFYKKAYEDVFWTKKEFPKNMFNYLCFRIRTNPKGLTEHHVEFMKGHFTFHTLGMDDYEKVIKINQYFSKTNDPFSPDIPSRYEDVRPEIRMLLPMVLSSEKLFLRIVKDARLKYS